jgi:Multiubiquitin
VFSKSSTKEVSMSTLGEKSGLHIFVNRRKFEEGDGVTPRMTGAQIAALVGVPPENAVVRFDTGPDKGGEIGIGQTVDVKNGDHFLVTRVVVEGGYEYSAD